jgi:hypothetical protein
LKTAFLRIAQCVVSVAYDSNNAAGMACSSCQVMAIDRSPECETLVTGPQERVRGLRSVHEQKERPAVARAVDVPPASGTRHARGVLRLPVEHVRRDRVVAIAMAGEKVRPDLSSATNIRSRLIPPVRADL